MMNRDKFKAGQTARVIRAPYVGRTGEVERVGLFVSVHIPGEHPLAYLESELEAVKDERPGVTRRKGE